MHSPALGHWLRVLWGRLPPLEEAAADAPPFIAGGRIHLARATQWKSQRAAAAHAAAHLVYSRSAFDATGLVPLARTLLALLEDARVEALAMRELPGLARLWRPLHTATPEAGDGAQPLMQRLSRALIDPHYDDQHPWVRKGRRLFYLDEPLGLLALRTPAELRRAAMALGHDLGQARLPFNARGEGPAPDYRDDHRWMWPADQLAPVAPQPPPQPPPPQDAPAARTTHGPSPAADPPPVPSDATTTRQPEWDRLIRRARHGWVTVISTQDAAVRPARGLTTMAATGPAQPPAVTSATPTATATPSWAQDVPPEPLLAPLRRLAVQPPQRARWQRSAQPGDRLDLDAVLAWQIDRHAGRSVDARLYQQPHRRGARPAAWLLVDQSASSGEPAGPGGHKPGSGPAGPPRLAVAAQAAAATAQALQRLGVACGVSAFYSHGRHAVRLHAVQGLHQAGDGATLAQRLQALRGGGSTRLGAALRQLTQQLRQGPNGPRWLLVLSDAQVHDIDVHDPLYLLEDARHAVLAAARRGVRIACLTLAAPDAGQAGPSPASARHIFGPGRAQPLATVQALPRALRRLLA